MNVGQAVFRALADFSNLRNESRKTARQLDSDAKQMNKSYTDSSAFGSGFSRVFSRISSDSGKAADSSSADAAKVGTAWGGVSSALTRVQKSLQESAAGGKRAAEEHSAAVKKTEAAVTAASVSVQRAKKAEADAAGAVTVAEARLSEARRKGGADSAQVVAAQERLSSAHRRSADAQDNTARSTERLSAIYRRSSTDISGSSKKVSGDLHQMARDVEQSGTRGGRAFTKAFIGVVGGLSVITPAVGAAGAALVAGAGNVITLASSLGQLGGVAALIPAGIIAIGGAVGVMKAAFSGVGTALKTAVEAQDAVSTSAKGNADAIEDASRAIVRAEQNAASAREGSQRRLSSALQKARDVQAEGARRVADAEASAAEDRVQSDRNIERARKGLTSAIQDAATRQASAVRRVADAERDVERANRRVADSQKDLTQARADAVKQVRELSRSLESAGLSEREAAIRFEEAQAAFEEGATRGGTPNLEYRKLKLDLDQAAFGLQEAKDRTKELSAEQQQAAADGVNGNKQVISAERSVADAREAAGVAARQRQDAVRGVAQAEVEGAERIAEAQQSVTDAVTEGSRSQVQAQQAIADATQEAARSQQDAAAGVADAYRNLEEVQASGAEAVADAYRGLERVQIQQADAAAKAGQKAEEALAKLTPAAQTAVGALLSVYDQLGAVRDIAQENFFAGFAEPLIALASVVIPQLLTGVGAIATQMGAGAQILMGALSGALGGGVLEGLLMGIATSVGILNGGLKPLVDSFVTLGVVGMTYMPRLATAIVNMLTRFDEFVQRNTDNGQMFVWIDNGIQAFKDLFSVAGSIVGIFGAISRAAEMGGASASLGGLADGLNRIQTIMEGPVFQKTMATIFAGAEAGAQGLLRALGPIGDAFVRGAPALAEFLRLGGEIAGLFAGALFTALSNPAFGAGLTTFLGHLLTGVQNIAPLLPGLTTAFGSFLKALGPITEVLGPTLVTVFTAFATSIASVLRVLDPLLVALAGSPLIIGTLIAAFAATKAASAALTAVGNIQVLALGAWRTAMFLLGKTAGGGIPAMLGKAGVAFRALGAAMAANPIGAVIAAVAALVAGLIYFFTQTEIGKKLWAGFMSGLQDAAAAVSAWFTGTFVPALSSAWESIKAAWSGAVDWFTGLWDGIKGGAGDAVEGVKGVWAGIGEWFSGIWQSVRAPFDEAWEGIKGTASGVSAWFRDTFLPALTTVFYAVGAPVRWLYEKAIKPIFDSILVIANGLWMGMKGVFNLLVAFLQKIVGPAIASLYNRYVKPVFDWIGEKVRAVIGAVVAFLTERLENIKRNWSAAWTWVSTKVAAIWDAISSKISAVFNYISKWIQSKLLELQVRWHFIWTTIKRAAAAVWDSIWSKIRDVWNVLAGFLTERLENLKRNWNRAWTWIRDKASHMWTNLKDNLRSVYNRYIAPLFNALGDFLTKTLPDRFQTGINKIGRIWNKLKELARIPIAFVINDVINRGLIGNFNKIADKLKVTRLPNVAMPFGLATGGVVPGHSSHPRADNIPIMATADEYMIRQTSSRKMQRRHPGALDYINRTGEIPGYATGGRVAGEAAFFAGNASNVARHGAYYLNVPGSMAAWNFKGAASLWDGASGAKVKTGMGRHQGWASQRERGGGILGYTVGNNIDMSPSWMGRLGPTERRTTSAHEMGHAMGLPHTNRTSIMKPNLGQMSSIPTAFDIANMQHLFPGGSGKAGNGKGEDRSGSGIFAAFGKIVSGILTKIRESIPGAGLFKDIAVQAGKKALSLVVDWAKGKLGSIKDIAEGVWNGIKSFLPGIGGAATVDPKDGKLYDGGGKVDNGDTLVRNRSGKPEALLTGIQWRHVVALIATANQMTQQIGSVIDTSGPMRLDPSNLLGPVPAGATATVQADQGAMRQAMTENRVGDTYNVDRLIVNNPAPERASDSLPKTIRGLTSIGVGKR